MLTHTHHPQKIKNIFWQILCRSDANALQMRSQFFTIIVSPDQQYNRVTFIRLSGSEWFQITDRKVTNFFYFYLQVTLRLTLDKDGLTLMKA